MVVLNPTGASFRLPDPPPREPDEVTAYDHLHKHGSAHYLAQRFGSPETTLVEADRWIVAAPGTFRERARYPDLLIAFDVNAAAYETANGYVVSEQGKPPDFVLEVASPSTAEVDTGAKRVDYAALGVGEYWRFDHTGEHHGSRLAGDRLVDGRYVPVPVRPTAAGVWEGYSPALDLILRWELGELRWIDPATGEHIATFEAERVARERAEAVARRERTAARRERTARQSAEAQAQGERTARQAAEARIRELEGELRRRDDEPGS